MISNERKAAFTGLLAGRGWWRDSAQAVVLKESIIARARPSFHCDDGAAADEDRRGAACETTSAAAASTSADNKQQQEQHEA